MDKRILFVDDEPNVLQGLKRSLHDMRREWHMKFAESGEEALKILAESPYDVIVSDMRMPGMDGAQLLEKVMEQYPKTVRIVLSGHSDQDMILKSVGPSHQYLAKPCDVKILKSTIERACALQSMLTNETLKLLVSQMKSLPSFPSLYFELIEEMKKPNCSMDKVGKIINKDISMSAKILQLVNSAYFGLPQKVASPAQAANLIGLDAIRGLVLSTHVFSRFNHLKLRMFSIDKLWSHSVATGAFAKEICKLESQPQNIVDEAFIGGLLHDVGSVVLAANLPEKYEEVLELAKREKLCAYDAEYNVFSTSHAELGAYLLGLWGLPNSVVEPVFFHHTPKQHLAQEFNALTAVYAANVIEASIHQDDWYGSPLVIDTDYLSSIGMGARFVEWEKACLKMARKAEN